MDFMLTIVVLTALLRVVSAQTRQYYLVKMQVNWTEAQSLCRRDFTDLATVENAADVEAVLDTTSDFRGKAWIGLHDDLENSWRWSLNDSSFYGEGEATFRNWYSGQPNNLNGQEYCVELLSGSPNFGTWNDTECSEEKPFVFYNGTLNGTVSFAVSGLTMNWTDSQRYCRKNYIEFASIRNQTENTIIATLANGSSVWIGLYRQSEWSDGSHSAFQHWASGQPSSGAEQCVSAAFNDTGRWSDENCSLNFPFICYKIAPHSEGVFRASSQNETSITLQWNKVNNNISFVLQFNGSETKISAPVGDGPVTHTVSSLSAGTKYTFTLFSVFDNVRSSGLQLTAVTVPTNPEDVRPQIQLETYIILQWSKVNDNISFVLQFNGSETNISAPVGDGPVTHTVSSLSAGTKYTFTLFSVFDNVRSSGVSITAVTAPPRPKGLRQSDQNETSITLQWNKEKNNISFVLLFNGTETNISAPDGDGPVTHTISPLSAESQYLISLFSVFENVRGYGVSIPIATGPSYVIGLDLTLESLTKLSESELEDVLADIFRRYAFSIAFSVKVRSTEP